MKKNKIFVLFFILFFCNIFSIYSQQANITIEEAAKRTEANFYWDPLSCNGVFEKNGHQISFRTNEQLILLDYSKLAITDAPKLKDGIVYVSEGFISAAEELFEENAPEAYYRVGAILIDPGHGGKDPGAIGSYKKNGKNITINEKDITLRISKLLVNQLKTAYPDKNILMTRSDDKWLSLEDRVELANSVKLEPHEAILYISIHVNASLDKNATGYEVWYLSPGYRRTVIDSSQIQDDVTLIPILNSMLEEEYTTESVLIAKFIMDGLNAQIGEKSISRGIKEEEWFVVRNANMPSVLIETGFITNAKEAALLDDENYLRKLAYGIYNGLSAFVTHFERSRGFTGS